MRVRDRLNANTIPPSSASPGAIWWRSLRDSLGGMLAWGVGFSVLLASVTVLYPSLAETGALLGVIEGLGILDAVLAQRAADVAALSTFPGYLALEALGWAPIVLAAYLVPQGIAAVMGEEQRGTLDLLLGGPLPRWRLLVEKTLAILVTLAGVLAIMLLSLIAVTQLTPDVELAPARALAGIWHVFPISTCILCLTLLLSVTLRSARTVGGAVALFIAASFFLRSLADATGEPLLVELRRFSLFHYYTSIDALTHSLQWQHDLALLALAGVLFLAALYQFQRRDLRG